MVNIFLFGNLRVEIEGKAVPETAWSRRKVKSLLKLLVLQPGYRLHKETALEILWPDLESEAAANNLYRSLHHLRQILDPGLKDKAESKNILFKEEVIRLNPANLWVDIEVFQKLLAQSRQKVEALNLLEEALSLYSGDLLEEDLYEEWTILRREELKRNYSQVLLILAELYRKRKNYSIAIAYLQRILLKEPTNESAHRELILCYTLSGQRTEAVNQYQQCLQVLSNDLGLDPSPETLELYEKILAGLIRADREAGNELQTNNSTALSLLVDNNEVIFNNLPNPVTSIIGRESESKQAIGLLREEGVRLLTMIGPAGVGKTRLALKIAKELAEQPDFVNGVCFVSLAELNDGTLLFSIIAKALKLRELSNEPLAVRLKTYLEGKKFLLVLDNFEHLTAVSTAITELLNHSSGLKILVTSRSVLHLYGEYEMVIHPLKLPPPRAILSTEELARFPGVALFIQRAKAVNNDFSLTPENVQIITEICCRLDGLPLAIELVASWAKLLPPEIILKRLSMWLQLVSSNAHDVTSRQQMLRNALDWSYNLMSLGEQRMFMRLAVFANGSSLKAIEALFLKRVTQELNNKEIPNSLQVFNQLVALVDKSLLIREETDVVQAVTYQALPEVRFGMLKVIHEYALKKLRDTGEETVLRELHLKYFLEMAESLEPKLHLRTPSDGLRQLKQEQENLEAALHWALGGVKDDELLLEKGLRLAGSLAWFWQSEGCWSEGSKWLEKGLSRSKGIMIPASVRAKALYAVGVINLKQGNLGKAHSRLQESLALYQNFGDKWSIAHTLDALAEAERQQGNYEVSRIIYEKSLNICNELGDHYCANYALISLGYLSSQQGDYHIAHSFFQKGLAACWKRGDLDGIARGLRGMGDLLKAEGDLDNATLNYQKSLALYWDLGQSNNIIALLCKLGQAELAKNHFEQAATFFKESMILSYKKHNYQMLGCCLAGLSRIAVASNAPEEAAYLFGAAEGILKTDGGWSEPKIRSFSKLDRANLRAKLDDAVLAASWERGRKTGLVQILASILNPGARISANEDWKVLRRF